MAIDGGLTPVSACLIDHIPENAILNPKPLPRRGDPNTRKAWHISLTGSLGQEAIALRLQHGFCGTARGHLGKRIPVELPLFEGAAIGVIKNRLGFGAVGNQDKGSLKEGLGNFGLTRRLHVPHWE